MKNKKYTVIIGCGRLGSLIANELSDKEENVTIIDCDKNSFRKLSPSYGGLTICANAMNMEVLKEAQIQEATNVIVVTNSDNTNIIISQMLKEIFKISSVISRLYDYDRKCVYEEFNIKTICPSVISAKKIIASIDEVNCCE